MTAQRMHLAEDSPAAARGRIQAGETGDKVPGFDPAAAPLETDAEAGGTPVTAEEMALARAAPAPGPASPKLNATSHAPAMREFHKPEPPGERAMALGIVIVTCLLAVVVLVIGLLLL
jgi:hypothetical protein